MLQMLLCKAHMYMVCWFIFCRRAALKVAAEQALQIQLYKTLPMVHLWTPQPDHSQNHC